MERTVVNAERTTVNVKMLKVKIIIGNPGHVLKKTSYHLKHSQLLIHVFLQIYDNVFNAIWCEAELLDAIEAANPENSDSKYKGELWLCLLNPQ